MADRNSTEGDGGRNKASHDSIPERATFWISLLIVIALFTFLTYRAFSSTPGLGGVHSKPAVTVRVDTSKSRKMAGERWMIPVTTRNSGGLPLEEVMVRVNIRGKDGKPAEIDLSFSYLAEGGSDESFIVTELPPDIAKPVAAVIAFKTRKNARGY